MSQMGFIAFGFLLGIATVSGLVIVLGSFVQFRDWLRDRGYIS